MKFADLLNVSDVEKAGVGLHIHEQSFDLALFNAQVLDSRIHMLSEQHPEEAENQQPEDTENRIATRESTLRGLPGAGAGYWQCMGFYTPRERWAGNPNRGIAASSTTFSGNTEQSVIHASCRLPSSAPPRYP